MRDRQLLKDLLYYLELTRPTDVVDNGAGGLGRLNKHLAKRLEKEIELGPQEFEKLCRTTTVLFEDSRAECKPEAAWKTLTEKMTNALMRKGVVPIAKVDAPFVEPYLSRDPEGSGKTVTSCWRTNESQS